MASNPLKFPGHHVEYHEAKALVDNAYAIRMRYLGVRHDQTAYTMDVQGTIKELIDDYKHEKENIIKEELYVNV